MQDYFQDYSLNLPEFGSTSEQLDDWNCYSNNLDMIQRSTHISQSKGLFNEDVLGVCAEGSKE